MLGSTPALGLDLAERAAVCRQYAQGVGRVRPFRVLIPTTDALKSPGGCHTSSHAVQRSSINHSNALSLLEHATNEKPVSSWRRLLDTMTVLVHSRCDRYICTTQQKIHVFFLDYKRPVQKSLGFVGFVVTQ
jgi:hypothetical protein